MGIMGIMGIMGVVPKHRINWDAGTPKKKRRQAGARAKESFKHSTWTELPNC